MRPPAIGRSLLCSITLVSAALACAAPPPVAPGPPVQPAPPRAPAAAPAPPLDATGRWVSPPCDARGFERILEVRAGGRFRLEDRVSPCPEGMVCVWEGIQVVEGRVRMRGRSLVLLPDGDPGSVRIPVGLELMGRGPAAVLEGDLCPLLRGASPGAR